MILDKEFLNFRILIWLIRLLGNFPFDKTQIERIQRNRLQKLLIYCYENYNFYKELWSDAHFNPYKFQDLSQIRELPIIDKQLYRDFTDKQVQKNSKLYERYSKDFTSGSTGIPLRIYRTWDERAYMLAKYLRALFLNGYKIYYTTFSLPAPFRKQKSDSILQKLGIMRRFCVTWAAPVENMVAGFLAANADVIYGNVAQLMQMALYIEKEKIKIKSPRLVIAAGEILDGHSKAIIMKAFGDRLIDIYGSVEFNNLAFQKYGNDFYYFNHDTNVLETENNGRFDDNVGTAIITDLHITSFPLIRYRLGDWLETSVKDGLKVITSIQGREDDWIKFKDGSRLPCNHLYQKLITRPGVLQYRFVQKSHQLIQVFLVLEPGIDQNTFSAVLLHDLRMVLDQFEYQIYCVDHIDVSSTGKLCKFLSEVKD